MAWPEPDPFFALRRTLQEILRKHEEEYEIELTEGAIEMLSIPIFELVQQGRDINLKELEVSLEEIIRSVKEDPAEMDMQRKMIFKRSSLSVIRAFWRKFCNIPPFCSRGQKV